MRRWFFYASLIAAGALALWFAKEQEKLRDARFDARRALTKCIDGLTKLEDASIALGSVKDRCQSEIQGFRQRGCEKGSDCEVQIENRLKTAIGQAQKRYLATQKAKFQEKQRADEIRIVTEKLGMTEDQLFDWILKYFKDDLLEALDDDFKLRYAPDDRIDDDR
jgi:hypothetical protein